MWRQATDWETIYIRYKELMSRIYFFNSTNQSRKISRPPKWAKDLDMRFTKEDIWTANTHMKSSTPWGIRQTQIEPHW